MADDGEVLVQDAAHLVDAGAADVVALLPLALIAYVPLTIAPLLTNMRDTISVQPMVFLFMALALMAPFSRRRR